MIIFHQEDDPHPVFLHFYHEVYKSMIKNLSFHLIKTLFQAWDLCSRIFQ